MRKMLIVLLLGMQAACWSDKVTGSSTVFGTYTLRTVNGSFLPFTVSGSGTTKSEIVADTIFLYEGFTFAESAHYRNTVNGTVTLQRVADNGSFGLLGNSISFFSADGSPVKTYVIDADVMHVVKPGLALDFRK
ncbi:MAG TPA: hypothetical protein VM053_07585 [Gemmatimonadaceae bacterium]|nr:hypothetical protein [Gemmatimonadaceae bacterium]